jgi:hypothetical protein
MPLRDRGLDDGRLRSIDFVREPDPRFGQADAPGIECQASLVILLNVLDQTNNHLFEAVAEGDLRVVLALVVFADPVGPELGAPERLLHERSG